MACGWHSTKTGSVAAAPLRATALLTSPGRKQGREDSERFLRQIAEEAQTVAATHEHFPGERLKLLFVCAPHTARTPLMLQTVLGVDAARIASALLVSPAAMGQRLVRDKKLDKPTSWS
jgi:RNA polymerase sigma-70 factor (ECF subfamily)